MTWSWVRPALVAGVIVSSSAGAASALCVRGVESWDTLRVRAAPAAGAREIGALPANACGVTVAGACRGAWCPIEWRGRRGWSNASYLANGGVKELVTSPLRFFASAQPMRTMLDPQRVARASSPAARPPARAAARPPIERVAAHDRPVSSSPAASRAAGTTASLPPAPLPAPAPSPAVQAAPEQVPIVSAPLATAATLTAAVPPSGPQPKFTAPLVSAGEVCVVEVDKGDTLKVRAGPGADQPLRYGYPAGACGVKITGACANGWCPVDYRNYRGWAEQKYLR